jgi:hypothetical protein
MGPRYGVEKGTLTVSGRDGFELATVLRARALVALLRR